MWQDITHNLQAELADLRGTALLRAGLGGIASRHSHRRFAVAWLLHAAILVSLRRLLRNRRPYLRTILDATKDPDPIGASDRRAGDRAADRAVAADTECIFAKILTLATICLVGWIALTVLQIGANLYLLRFRMDVDDNLMARKHITQVRVLVRAFDTVISC